MGNNSAQSPSAEAGENLHVRNPIEIPVAPAVAAKLMERFGQATDRAESPEFTEEDVTVLTQLALRMGASVLDDSEWFMFTGVIGGEDVDVVAKRAQLTPAKAAKALKDAGEKIRAELERVAVAKYVNDALGKNAKGDEGFDLIRGWFSRGLVASKLHQWGPLAALLFMYAAANDDRELSIADAYRVCGAKPPVTEALKALQGLGYVDVNVVTSKIKIRKLPTDAPRAPAKEAA